MKTKKSGKSSVAVESYSCMVRGLDGEPKPLYVDAFDGKSIALKPIEGPYDKALWFPRQIAFSLDPELLADLRAAYRENNQPELESLWSQAKKWEPMNA